MTRSIFSKVMWVGRATVFVVGLAVILALTVGLATTALAGTGVGARFQLGQTNSVNAITKLVGSVAGPSLQIDNNSTGAAATALDLQVEAGKAPMKVNSETNVANLNADKLDGLDSGAFLGANGTAANADKLDNKDSSEFLGTVQKAADSDKLGGLDSTQFMGTFSGRMDAFTSESNSAQLKTISVQCPGTGRVVDGYAEIYPNTASAPIPVALQTVGSIGDNIWKATASEMAPYDGNWGISVNVLCVKSPPGS
jgi:hypothetical protein